MSFVDPTSASSAAGAATASAGSGAATGQNPTGLNQLDNSQTFLKLLVAQLKNQSPDNPTDPTSFMTEIAQLTAVQSQTSLNAEEQTVAADSMIGRSVTGTEANGQQVNGTVTGVLLSASGAPQLQLSGSAGASGSTPPVLALDAVTRVYGATGTTGTTSTPATPAATSTSTSPTTSTSSTAPTSSTPPTSTTA